MDKGYTAELFKIQNQRVFKVCMYGIICGKGRMISVPHQIYLIVEQKFGAQRSAFHGGTDESSINLAGSQTLYEVIRNILYRINLYIGILINYPRDDPGKNVFSGNVRDSDFYGAAGEEDRSNSITPNLDSKELMYRLSAG